MNDLQQASISEHLELVGSQRAIASCVIYAFDHEKFSVGELSTPVTRSVTGPDGNSTDLQAGMPASPAALFWSITLKQAGDKAVIAEVVARRDVNPYLSSHYMIDKVKTTIHACAGARA